MQNIWFSLKKIGKGKQRNKQKEMRQIENNKTVDQNQIILSIILILNELNFTPRRQRLLA